MDDHGVVAALYVALVLVTAVPASILAVAAYRVLGGSR